MAEIALVGVTCAYPGEAVPAVGSLDLTVRDGELLVLLGPPGAGKTTVLRMIAGLVTPTDGRVLVGGRDVVGSGDHDVAMVFQNYALYPHLSVAENIGIPLQAAGMSRHEVRDRVEEVATVLELRDLLGQGASGLTPSQRIRVALARGLVRRPSVLLMDEPLANLAPAVRADVRQALVAAQRAAGVTTVYATDDQLEAVLIADRVGVLEEGRLHQCDEPRRLYDRPRTLFVAALLGSPPMNFLDVRVEDGRAMLGDTGVVVPAPVGPAGAADARLGVRPEDVRPVAAGGLELEVQAVTRGEGVAFASGQALTGGRRGVRLTFLVPRDAEVAVGDVLTVLPDPSAVHLFDPRSGERLDP